MRPGVLQVVLFLLLVPIAQTTRLAAQGTSVSPAAADTAAVRAWIRDHAIALTTAEPGNGFGDLQPLRQIVGDARIVALGEATHGTREFFQLKHRMLEFLVSEMDFNIFAMEAPLPEALDVNRYVLSGEGDPARALAGIYFWTWDTEEVLALIRWMREYNLTETGGRKVKFYGFDEQFTARAARTVLDYLHRVDAAAGSRADWVMDPLADPFVSREIGPRWSEERQQELADSLRRVVADFDERLDAYAAMTSVEEAGLVRRHLEILLQAVGTEDVSRDAAMAANVAWLMGREGPDSKAVLWAHNQHVAVQEGSQGEALRRMFGDELRVFGFAFDRGGFQARDVMVDGALRPWLVDGAPDTTLEAHLRAAAPEVALIDLRSLPEAGPVASWFMAPQTMRTIGSGYTYERPDWYWWRAPVAQVYDALVFVEETTPARANLTGRVPGLGPPTHPANLDFEVGLPGAWPLGWIMPRGAAKVEWDVRLTRTDAREGEQAVVIRRAPGPSYGETHAALSQRADASPWRGQRVTLQAWVRVDDATESRGYLWVEVTEPGDPYSESVFYHSTGPITASEWRQYRIATDVSEAADVISFGFAFVGDGGVWLDGVSLERQEPGSRSFDRQLALEDSAATSANVSIGDMNADGHQDILLVKGRHWPLENLVLLGDGSGSFQPPYPVGQPDRSYSGVLVDLDRDGDLDLVVSNDNPDAKLVHLNDGNGRFTNGSMYGQPEWPTRHISVTDLNNDSLPDVVLANRNAGDSGVSYICFGVDGGRFETECVGFARGSATTITPADFNNDGVVDLAVPHRDGGQSFIYLNDGEGGFEERRPFGPPTAAIRSAKAADLDGDGRLDLVVIDERSGPGILWGRPDGTYAPVERLGASQATPYSVAVADLDRNGRMDVIVGFVESRPVVYFNDGPEAFVPVPFGDEEGVAYGFAVGDLDEDGLLDIAMARSGAKNMVYFGSSPNNEPR